MRTSTLTYRREFARALERFKGALQVHGYSPRSLDKNCYKVRVNTIAGEWEIVMRRDKGTLTTRFLDIARAKLFLPEWEHPDNDNGMWSFTKGHDSYMAAYVDFIEKFNLLVIPRIVEVPEAQDDGRWWLGMSNN